MMIFRVWFFVSIVFFYFQRFIVWCHGIILLFKTKMINSIARDLNFDISMCDHWSGIVSSDHDGQDTSRPPPNPSHPSGQYFKLCQGNKLRKKLPWAKSATQGLVKSETDLLSICKSRLLFFSSIYSRIPFASSSPKAAQKPHTRRRADQKKTRQVTPNYEWDAQ